MSAVTGQVSSARSGEVHVAYQTLGGPVDVALALGGANVRERRLFAAA